MLRLHAGHRHGERPHPGLLPVRRGVGPPLDMAISRQTLQSSILKLLAGTGVDRRLGQGQYYFPQLVMHQFSENDRPTPDQVAEILWTLLGQGLVYIDMSQSAPTNWQWRLSSLGLSAVSDQEVNPDDPSGYLTRLRTMVPQASQTVLCYADEAVRSYTNRCYLASATMLGVASEAAFLEVATAFGAWLPGEQGQKFLSVLNNPRQNYIAKFSEFRKRVEPEKPKLPTALADGMALTMDSVLDLLRIYRNDAGHPTGKDVTREDAFINLQMFARYLQKLYLLKAFFESNPND